MIWLGHPQQLAPAGQGQETVAACAEAMASVCDIMQLGGQRDLGTMWATADQERWPKVWGLHVRSCRHRLGRGPVAVGEDAHGTRLDRGLAAEQLYGERTEEGRDAVLLQQVQVNEVRHGP